VILDVMFSKASDEWSTPQGFYDALDAEFGFWLDAAASVLNHKCRDWWAEDDDALTTDWLFAGEGGAVWLNPPYSKCRQFIAKAAQEARKGATVVCLVPSRTDTRWWHEHVWDACTNTYRPGVEVRFIKGRLKFGGSTNSAPFPSCVVIFRPPSESA
jgi:phage N-6-adenine-methyltransferase